MELVKSALRLHQQAIVAADKLDVDKIPLTVRAMIPGVADALPVAVQTLEASGRLLVEMAMEIQALKEAGDDLQDS